MMIVPALGSPTSQAAARQPREVDGDQVDDIPPTLIGGELGDGHGVATAARSAMA